MTQVINFSVDQSQLHSPGSFLGQSTGFLEVSTTYRSFIGARVGSSSVTGKRILSQSALYRPENDNSSKYPVPVQVFKKPKKPRKTLDLQNEDNSNLSQKHLSRSKTERKSLGKIQPKPPIHPSKAKLAKETTKMSKTLILNKHLVQSKSQKKMTENKKSPSKSFSIPEIKIRETEIKPEMTKTTEDKEPRSVIRIDDIVKNTLIQEKVKKVKKIKAEQKQKAENELRKFEQKIHNNQIRQENSVKFRQEKFHPKIAWGANGKKILGLDTIKLQKEIEEERRHQREIRARTKSAEKDRLGLETLAELRIELGTISRSKSVSQEIIKPFKASKKSDPKLKAFIKVKKQSRKESKEQEMLHHQAEEAKRLTQLKQLDIFAKSQINLKKKKKRKLSKKKNNKKKPTKTWMEDSPISGSEEQSYQPLSSRRMINERSDSKESFQEYFISPAINKGKEEFKTQDILKKHIKYTNLEQNNQSGNIDFQDSTINDQNLLESSSSNGKIINESNTSIEFRKNDIKKRLDDLRYRIGKVKENLREASPNTQNQAATKIQANIRRFLTQKRLTKDFADEDEEVQKILSKDPSKFKKNLEIQIEESPYSPSDTSSEIPPENLMNILSPKTSTTNLEDRLIEELKNIEEIKHQKDEFKDILKDQLIWQENQKQNLQKLKEKELRELKEVTKKLGQGKELEKMLAEIIENRYLHLTNLIVENIANVQEALTKEQNLKQNEEQNMREYTGDSSSEGSYFESQGSDKFMELFSKKIQKNIESDSDSLRPDELEKLMRELNKNKNFEESEDLLKLKTVREMKNAPENDEDKQFSDAPSYLSNISAEIPQKIKSPTFGQTGTETDECDEIIQKIMSNESYKSSENESLKSEENKESFQEPKNSFECISELEELKEVSQEQKTSFLNESSASSIKKNESLVEIETKSDEIIKETDNEIGNLYDSESLEEESPRSPPNPPMGSPQVSEGPSITSFELPKNILSLQQAEIFIEEGKSPEASAFVKHDNDSLDELQMLTPEPSSQTPESLIDRPSAPFLSSDSEDDKSKPLTPLPELKLEASEAKIHLPPDLFREITPELISIISESILQMLISEDIIPKPSFPEDPNLKEEVKPEPSLYSGPAIQTDHLSVQKYVDEIFDLALKNIDDFLINLKKPLKRNALEVLSRMQAAKIGTPIETEFVMPPAVLNVNYYLNLEHPREAAHSQRCLSPNTIQMISECEHIHNKMIFDATNEALQKYRPYGLKGVPLPWSTSSRQLVNLHKNPSIMISEIKTLIEKWSLVQAGKVPTQDMVLTGGNFDEEYVQQMREERLASMLADDIIEKDNIWVEYEFEEVQVKLDLADMVLEDLVIETVNILDQDN
ncbi:unnamed protein product [Blepharisma stoltei]|uniref:DUF4378 domain-containing protein n=1 Tax=Blepharisma stoltei TaxID=1481888 RepID=A0AAU9JIH7_9CILI|nr:unnamed protein product [Blepharisma stoltei]